MVQACAADASCHRLGESPNDRSKEKDDGQRRDLMGTQCAERFDKERLPHQPRENVTGDHNLCLWRKWTSAYWVAHRTRLHTKNRQFPTELPARTTMDRHPQRSKVIFFTALKGPAVSR